MASLTDRFSPFGIALFAVLLIGLLFFAYLMTQRGSEDGGAENDGTEQTQGAGSTAPATVPAP